MYLSGQEDVLITLEYYINISYLMLNPVSLTNNILFSDLAKIGNHRPHVCDLAPPTFYIQALPVVLVVQVPSGGVHRLTL